MALKEYKLPFGRGFQTVMLPEERVSDVLEGVPTGRTPTRKISNVWEKKWRDALPCTSMTAGIKTCSPVWA